MIKNVLIDKKTLSFKEPFKIAYETVSKAEIVIVKIEDEKGNYGLGSASPDTEVTGETIEDVFWILKTRLTRDYFTDSLDNWRLYHQRIQQDFQGFPSAQSAAEEALLNLLAVQKKVNLTYFFGQHRKKCNIMMTVGIKDLLETIADVKERLKQGYKMIKLKCGENVEQDIEKVLKIKEIKPADFQLVIDVNQGYSLKEAEKFIKSLSKTEIKLIEQPVKAGNIEGLGYLNKLSPIPIIADESVVSVSDAAKLIKNDLVSGVNIKLMKCGGPINFLKIFHLVKGYRKIMMIGCMYESHISITTGACLALALPIDYVDLDSGRLDFDNDPTVGGANINKGEIQSISPLKLK